MKDKKIQVSTNGELRMYDFKSIGRGIIDVVITILALTVVRVLSGVDSLEDLFTVDFVATLVSVSSLVLSKTARKFLSRTEYVE